MVLDESRLCICVPSLEAASFIRETTSRIPWDEMPADMHYHVLYIDNDSRDGTWEEIGLCREDLSGQGRTSDAIRNPYNYGYGGSVKLALDYCNENDFGYLVILHADGQYRPEDLPRLLAAVLKERTCALFFGSRISGDPLGGGMPWYKYVGNLFLTWLQNHILGTRLSEFHSGYRLYRTNLVCKLPYEHNSDYFDFDNHIIFQIVHAGLGVDETTIPTYYGAETSHVSIVRTPLAIVANVCAYVLHKWGLLKVRRYDAIASLRAAEKA